MDTLGINFDELEAAKFSSGQLEASLFEIVPTVFEPLLSGSVQCAGEMHGIVELPYGAAIVLTGPASLELVFDFSEPFACAVAAQFYEGDESAAVTVEQLQEAVMEIANIGAGQLKTRLSPHLQLSLPVARDPQGSVPDKGEGMVVCWCCYNGAPCRVMVGVRGA